MGRRGMPIIFFLSENKTKRNVQIWLFFSKYICSFSIWNTHRMYKKKKQKREKEQFLCQISISVQFLFPCFCDQAGWDAQRAERIKTENLLKHFSLNTILSRNKVCWIVGWIGKGFCWVHIVARWRIRIVPNITVPNYYELK